MPLPEALTMHTSFDLGIPQRLCDEWKCCAIGCLSYFWHLRQWGREPKFVPRTYYSILNLWTVQCMTREASTRTSQVGSTGANGILKRYLHRHTCHGPNSCLLHACANTHSIASFSSDKVPHLSTSCSELAYVRSLYHEEVGDAHPNRESP